MICLSAGVMIATLALQGFTLSWVHSVQKSEIQEDYRLEAGGLVSSEARIKGSGAGFDPPTGSRLSEGWWRWQPASHHRELILARSSAPGEWRICLDHSCQPLSHYLPESGDTAVRITACHTTP